MLWQVTAGACTTLGRAGVGCGLFLNTRYLELTTGTFLSVDPVISKTGSPYLYADGNPTTFSDPDRVGE